jgi:hypothetical protein
VIQRGSEGHRGAESSAYLHTPRCRTGYLVMEYVEGQPLKGPLPVERQVELPRRICIVREGSVPTKIGRMSQIFW